jgi:hypothetical protein
MVRVCSVWQLQGGGAAQQTGKGGQWAVQKGWQKGCTIMLAACAVNQWSHYWTL